MNEKQWQDELRKRALEEYYNNNAKDLVLQNDSLIHILSDKIKNMDCKDFLGWDGIVSYNNNKYKITISKL